MNTVTVITGPTASGKSSVAVRLAQMTGAEIVSADSVQVYRHMDIGSAKITEEEMGGIRHHMIDVFDPDEEFNVSVFASRAEECVRDILDRKKDVIIAGGSGLYVDALVYDSYSFDEKAERDEDYRRELEETAEKMGREHVHSMLEKVDPESASQIHPNNLKRVIRALEYYRLTGRKKSEQVPEKRDFRFDNTFYFCLTDERERLYERIDRRVDMMFEEGLEDEVRRLLEMGYDSSLVSMRALGYKETADFIEGRTDLEEAKYIIKRDTRHFAKRQLTWYRRNPDARWINVSDYSGAEEIAEYIRGIIHE